MGNNHQNQTLPISWQILPKIAQQNAGNNSKKLGRLVGLPFFLQLWT